MHAGQGPVCPSPKPELVSLHFLGGPGGFCFTPGKLKSEYGKFLKLRALGEKVWVPQPATEALWGRSPLAWVCGLLGKSELTQAHLFCAHWAVDCRTWC